MHTWYRYTGLVFMVTGALHTALGISKLSHVFKSGPDTGFVNSIQGYPERGSAFWFTITGLMMILTGYLMDWAVREKGLLLPAGFGYGLTGFCIIGIILMPRSGFWLVLLQALYLTIYSFSPS